MLRLDKQSPLARGLVFAVFPGGDRRHELVGGGLGVTEEANTEWEEQWDTTNQYTAPGGGYYIQKNSGDTLRYYWPWSDNIATVTTQATLIMWVLLTDFSNTSANLWRFPYTTDGTWVAPTICFGIGRATTTTSVRFTSTAAGVLNSIDSDTGMLATDGIFNALGVTRSGTSVIFYRNGIQHGASKTLGTSAATDWGQHANPTFFNRKSGSNGENSAGYLFFGGLWNRALSADEMYRFYQNPFRILVPKGAIF